MKVYIKKHEFNAGKWIYKGYKLAWEQLGYDAKYYADLSEITDKDYILMAIDADVSLSNLGKLERAKKVFLYAQPNRFPMPWGSHPNFVSSTPDHIIQKINNLENVFLWSFGDPSEFHFKWKKVHTVPLAYDSVSYKTPPIRDIVYDVCYIGGWANNGFNEKKKIMLDCFSVFRASGLKCGFFINRNLTHEQENGIIANSRVCLNIHDNYQRKLGLDTNERTFKSLGLNGVLISDKNSQLEHLFPTVYTSNDPREIVSGVKGLLGLTEREFKKIKEDNIRTIIKSHCYIHRVNKLLSL